MKRSASRFGRRRYLPAAWILLPALACRAPSTGSEVHELEPVSRQVLAALRAFEQAEGTRDPLAVLGFLSPDFSMLQDGRRVGHEETVAQIRATLPTLRAFEPEFHDVEVLVLAHDAALTSMVFHDVLTDAEGATTRMWGPSTLLWRKRDGSWRVVFADSDHYPEAESSLR
jgi:ketosteroid isomerase-like protein